MVSRSVLDPALVGLVTLSLADLTDCAGVRPAPSPTFPYWLWICHSAPL
jgi:hypothetical protein